MGRKTIYIHIHTDLNSFIKKYLKDYTFQLLFAIWIQWEIIWIQWEMRLGMWNIINFNLCTTYDHYDIITSRRTTIFWAFPYTLSQLFLMLLAIIFKKWCIIKFTPLFCTIFHFFLTLQWSLIPYHDQVHNWSW